MLCKGTGIDLAKCERGDPEVLGEGEGEDRSSAQTEEKRKGNGTDWGQVGVGMQRGNLGGAGLLLWLEVLNEETHMFHLNRREQQFCCQLTRYRYTVKGIFVLMETAQ